MSSNTQGSSRNDLTKEFIQWIGRMVGHRMNEGKWVEIGPFDWKKVPVNWHAYILTFMFHHIGGSKASVLAQMRQEVERVYCQMLTRVVRAPKSPSQNGRLPIWIISPDYPVYKHEKKALRDVAVNDGLHMSGVALIPPGSRLRQRLDHHLMDNKRLYIRPDHPLCRIHAVPVSEKPEHVADYSLKSVKRGRTSSDDILVLTGDTEAPRKALSVGTCREGRIPSVGASSAARGRR